MKTRTRAIFFLCLFLLSCRGGLWADEGKTLFISLQSREEFARDISAVLAQAWKKWQDSVVVGEVYVEGSQGILLPGELRGPFLTEPAVMEFFDRSGRSQDYIDCVRAVAQAVENGMRRWQRGYSHDNIPFPQGVSCVYTMPPSYNMPVAVSSGHSAGGEFMKKDILYNFMLYRVPYYEENVLEVFKAASGAISECFTKWADSCCIKGILAEGGVAPPPAPMGTGPGLVKGARGTGGGLAGAYFDGALMYDKMLAYFSAEEDPGS